MPIVPANLAFRAVLLAEARSYRITFVYHPWWRPYAWAAVVLAATLILAAAVVGALEFLGGYRLLPQRSVIRAS